MKKPKLPKSKYISSATQLREFEYMTIKERVALIVYFMQLHIWLFERDEK